MTPPLPERLRNIADIHTHRIENLPGALISITPKEAASFASSHPGAQFSVGIHPWHPISSPDAENHEFEILENALHLPGASAIGECGLDNLHGLAMERQIERFRRHICLSEKYHLPLIIHLVKAQDALLALRKELRPTQPWIIHGFRGKAAQANQLANAGLYVSFGEHFNPSALAIVPPCQRLAETDESPTPISTIIAKQREALQTK